MNNFGIWIDEKTNQEEYIDMFDFRELNPVSYTHLDVYKRQEYIDMFDFRELNLIKIQEKDQLKEIDGLIFVLSDKNNVIKMVEWLFECKTNPALFMWVFSEDGLDNEEEVLINLGVDGIFTSKENIKLFVLSLSLIHI
ncbi:hypothetical protein A5819_003835 [Enterococcus sp. 7E2_DIV0204]|uniref:hypothetical protein n=1 Tax=Enterococcus sp. 7E2_DIV0204 TaxID=1834188 RepID=UPI000A350997|nr:hypothetical protein [Enterococcus sp. 7E2_DIV0204]OTN82334.1 hypothetical protein A5819_003835 [Enterococcus sp. 7E2_DIV0204]